MCGYTSTHIRNYKIQVAVLFSENFGHVEQAEKD